MIDKIYALHIFSTLCTNPVYLCAVKFICYTKYNY